MKKQDKIKTLALKTLEIESASIAGLKNFIDDQFAECVNQIYASKGRVVVTGIGKSAIIGQKIVATLNSTGTPSIFMHAADAIHGDLGNIQQNDIILCISKSGDTSEIKVLIPLLKNWGNKLIGMTGNVASYLARHSDIVLNTTVEQEACPNNLAPTSSTVAQMAMGDALAVCLLDLRGFSPKDFAKYHPGGSLGKKLYLKVKDIYPGNAAPSVGPDDDIKKVIVEISSKRLGAAAVLEKDKIIGVITDGDLRRMLLNSNKFESIKARMIMSENPKTIDKDAMAADALNVMNENNISQLLVKDKEKYVGMIHIHDLIREGII
ncbi:MAG: KpsF/GutQ family sugar-phosphate isomerase [Bacteroidetes bacterium]|nr:MAG: KpsF/GutQ family sugar-phosphate isomerase [Bacteroidota bacterium]REK06632.1 MAG: KpsF/GutQ family sugar-phosphate isomerase [Bacteroidota bacterium]REK33398.1 MAG: KpsF/GutQ family sugar-phosphate isomerase [Bacteroidota bacterium]REK49797.1 MAG: KpsF/GutQ family sugar-phosphate isomerase [Bacteroidota bacterium]